MLLFPGAESEPFDRKHEAKLVLEKLREKIAREFGVTLDGNRLTLRWDSFEVHTIIVEVEDGRPACSSCGMLLGARMDIARRMCSDCACPK